MVTESQKWFVGLVATRRGIDTTSVAGLEQGRVFSGREALGHKLVDEIGGETEAVQWLEQKRSVPKGLKVVDWKPQRASEWSLLGSSAEALGRLIGGSVGAEVARLVGHDQTLGRLRLDGLISIWQGAER
jgi:protease-4